LIVIYKDVTVSSQAMEEMQRLAPGNRRVPVLLENGQMTIGFGGS
jgi:hypothetical protein